jgi:ABC-type transporter Mla subunit MlaD
MDSHELTKYFLIAIGIVFITGVIFRLFFRKKNKLILLCPNLSITIGILGTFTGVYFGLKEFDVSSINDSIPSLLEGLKTAFTTSIAGMLSSIVLKLLFESLSTIEQGKSVVKDENPIEILKTIAEGIGKVEISSKEIENSIVTCLRSDEEYSIISQMKLIRQEISDTRRDFNSSFNTFAEKMAEVNTNTLVEALEKVIADFNVLLSELVSESFKELSEAMVRLNEWQDKYRVHVDTTTDKIDILLKHLNDAVDIMEDSAKKLKKIDGNLESIDSSLSGVSVSAEDISRHIESLKSQNLVLQESLESIKKIGDDAKTVIPTMTESLNNISSNLEGSVNQVADRLDENTSKLTEFVDHSVQGIEQASRKQLEAVEKSIQDINSGLENELTQALNSLAGSMAALSGKFVEDYMPLTERLRSVVRLSEKLNA